MACILGRSLKFHSFDEHRDIGPDFGAGVS